jgi:hypothetical protein
MAQQNVEEIISPVEVLNSVEIEADELAQEIAIEHGYYDGPIPADLVAPFGLPPKRAELARFVEWHRRTIAEIEHLEEAHNRAVEALGGETVTKKKIDALIEADVAEVLKFALGGEAVTSKKLRAFERHQLEQKLKDDKHAAEVASTTLQEIDREIGIKIVGLKFLENRTDGFVKAALREVGHQSDLVDRYRETIDRLRALVTVMAGLTWYAGGGDGYRELQFQKWGFPELADQNLAIGFDENSLNAAAAPWRQLACKLLNNPTAQITLSTIFSEIDNDH